MAITDYSSIYTIKDFYQKEILPLFFDKDKLSLSNVGDLGMFLDITGATTEDMINIVARYINEIMPGMAELPDFIYANAANYGVENILATPAKMPMLLIVKENDILHYGKDVGGYKEFTIDADMSILIDDLRYSLPYDIKIRSTLFKGEYNHMSFYDKNYVNELAYEQVPFIKTMKALINGDIWLVLGVSVYQYVRWKYPQPINTNSKLNIPYIDLTYTDQLCGFEAFYTPAGSTTMTQLEKRMDTTTPKTYPFIYYKLTGDGSIRFLFANDDRYWIPDYNSTVTIYLYTTSGKAGNYGLVKDGLTITIRADTENEDIAYNRNIFPQGVAKGNSVNGIDQLTLEKIKVLTAEAQTTVKSYTTDVDLNTYFTNFVSVYEHNAIFVRQRDDYASREFGCFVRLDDGTDILPTNTLNVRIGTTQMDWHHVALRQWSIAAGTIFRYEDESNINVVVKREPDEEPDEIEYATMALMVVTTRPNSVKYYMNTINKNVEMEYEYFNLKSPFNFVVNDCVIQRDAIHGESEYYIELTLVRVDGVFNDIQSVDFMMQKPTGEIDVDRLEMLILFKTSSGHYIRMTCDTKELEEGEYKYVFSTTIGTTDMIDDKRILLTGLLKRLNGETDERLIDMMNPEITFAVFYRYDDITPSHDYQDIDVVKDHVLCDIYTPKEGDFYFAYPLNLIRSHVSFEDVPSSPDGFGFMIKQVPMFGRQFLLENDDLDVDEVLTDVVYEHAFISNIVPLLHAAFTINMKFYNTYGRSRDFFIGCGTDTEIINRVHCKIYMGIRFYEGILIDDYLEEIRIYIKKYFEEINRTLIGTNQVFISILDQKLHNKFNTQVKYAIFYSVNEYESKYQVIEMHTKIDDNPLPDFIPEYLTLKKDDVILTVL